MALRVGDNRRALSRAASLTQQRNHDPKTGSEQAPGRRSMPWGAREGARNAQNITATPDQQPKGPDRQRHAKRERLTARKPPPTSLS